MAGQILQPLTDLKLLTTNGINPTSSNNTNNHCRWLSCIVEGLSYEYGYTEMDNYEKMEKEIYIYLSITANTVMQGKTICILNLVLTNKEKTCHQQRIYISNKTFFSYTEHNNDCQRQASKLSELFIRSEDNQTTLSLLQCCNVVWLSSDLMKSSESLKACLWQSLLCSVKEKRFYYWILIKRMINLHKKEYIYI